MKTIAIVQARMGSTRFPGKVLASAGSRPMIELLLRRLSMAREVDQVIVATTSSPSDDPLAGFVHSIGFACERGDEHDVLARYLRAAHAHDAKVIVRITGDCPLVDPALVDAVIERYRKSNVDYASNAHPPTFPDGLDVEVFSVGSLERAAKETVRPYDREHVTPYLYESGRFQTVNYADSVDRSGLRWTVDEPEDLLVVDAVARHFFPRIDFSWHEILALSQERPQWFEANAHLVRNEGATLSTGQKLWKRAKRVIPGGSMLLSKRAEMFAPNQWPAYFSKAKGCRVWDLDGREWIDASMMGIGTNTLGYGHPEVDEAVLETVRAGNMTTLNAPEEVHLAERLIAMHPWADMARFARSGGEANAIAIRIARAATGKDKVAICGYHGWHDWYLSTNLAQGENLDEHLLPGLAPKGVPSGLRGTVLPFRYNDYDTLDSLVDQNEVGVIKMEVMRNHEPDDGFLRKVRTLADRKGIVLIFDECTSGFRRTFGGLHLHYGIEPDMAVFGKTLGNGYAVTAVLGKESVMQYAQDTFISSTFWTERIGSAAALKTLDVMERDRSWERITAIGSEIGRRWQELAASRKLRIRIQGLEALLGFTFEGNRHLAYKTLVTQEMLQRGFLAGTALYASIAHTPDVLGRYFEALDEVFALIQSCEEGRDPADFLRGPVCQSGFTRLN